MTDADVVIPTFNNGAELSCAVASALALSFVQRVIVIDDGSEPPASVEPDPRLTLFRTENMGPSAARNLGLDESRAPWVIFLDADDTLLDGIQSSVDLAERHGAALTLCGRVEVDEDGRESERRASPEWAGRSLRSAEDIWRPLWIFGTPGAVVARRVIDAGIRFDPEIRIGEDRDFFVRTARFGPVFIADSLGVRYRKDAPDSLSSAAHLARRARDHAVLADRHVNAENHPHWQERTAWLANQLARTGCDRETWRVLTESAARHGLSIPLKARLRRSLRLGGSR
ncbi:MAG: glycosyltransferase family 2 protein [Planctomycetota bacterium]